MQPAPLSTRQLYLRLLGYVRPYWRQFAASILGLVLVALSEPMIPALFKPLLDKNFVEKDPSGIVWMPLALVALFLVRGLGDFVSTVAMAWVGGKVILDLRMQMVDRLLHFPAQFFDQHSAGTVISKVTYDVNQVTQAATKLLAVVVRDSLAVVGLLAWMLYLNWELTLLGTVVAPVVVLIVRRVSWRLRELSRSLQRTYGEMTHILEEATEGHRVVKVFGGAEYEATRFGRSANWVRRFTFKSRAAASLNVPLVQLTTAAGLAAIVFIGSRQAVEGTLSVGGFVSFLAAMGMLFAPIKRLTELSEPLQRGLAAAESIFSLVDEPVEADRGTGSFGRAQGRLEFRDVTFRYPHAAAPAVQGLSLVIEPGETIALVGPSGSGKTTVAQLIPRFYDLESGRILIDGVDIGELQLAELRAQIAFVGQDVVLFNDTVAANIAYGGIAGASAEAVREAARAAHALEFIERLPEGFQTLIGDRGVRLSGGQRQRLAIARAILKDAAILVLDEATSALDTESERRVQAALEELRRGRSTLVIAHRLSTVENADRILVLKAGRVVESGTHRELLAAGGLYADLYRVQFSVDGPTSASAPAPGAADPDGPLLAGPRHGGWPPA
jgi:subfamily B ATP-binding cassette protein MsbA